MAIELNSKMKSVGVEGEVLDAVGHALDLDEVLLDAVGEGVLLDELEAGLDLGLEVGVAELHLVVLVPPEIGARWWLLAADLPGAFADFEEDLADVDHVLLPEAEDLEQDVAGGGEEAEHALGEGGV